MRLHYQGNDVLFHALKFMQNTEKIRIDIVRLQKDKRINCILVYQCERWTFSPRKIYASRLGQMDEINDINGIKTLTRRSRNLSVSLYLSASELSNEHGSIERRKTNGTMWDANDCNTSVCRRSNYFFRLAYLQGNHAKVNQAEKAASD